MHGDHIVDAALVESGLITIDIVRILLVNNLHIFVEHGRMQNIVMIEDYALIEQPESDEWLIVIRMEILESLAKYVRRTGAPDVNETVRIGVDMNGYLRF